MSLTEWLLGVSLQLPQRRVCFPGDRDPGQEPLPLGLSVLLQVCLGGEGLGEALQDPPPGRCLGMLRASLLAAGDALPISSPGCFLTFDLSAL